MMRVALALICSCTPALALIVGTNSTATTTMTTTTTETTYTTSTTATTTMTTTTFPMTTTTTVTTMATTTTMFSTTMATTTTMFSMTTMTKTITKTATSTTSLTSSSTDTTTTFTVPEGSVGTVVTGSLEMTVSDPDGFIANAMAKAAVRRACAALAGVPEDYIVVTLRRLSSGSSSRRLAAGAVVVSYSILIPEDNNLAATGPAVQTALAAWSPLQINDAITSEVDAAVGSEVFSIVIVSVTAPSLSIMTTTPEDGLASAAITCMAPTATSVWSAVLLAFAMCL